MSDETPLDDDGFASEVLIEALSRHDGTNSTIRVYEDRIEWLQEVTISSLPRSKDQPPVIPMSMVLSAKARQDGPMFSKVFVRTFTQKLVFRMYAPHAVAVRNVINELVAARPRELTAPPARALSPPPPPPPPPAPDPADENLRQLQTLLADGFITAEEFEAAKAQLGPS